MLLWQFLRVGHEPDVAACLSAIDEAVPAELDIEVQGSLELHGAPKSSQPLPTITQQPPEPEPGGRNHRREIVEALAALGSNLPALPLVRLRTIARNRRFVGNNDLT